MTTTPVERRRVLVGGTHRSDQSACTFNWLTVIVSYFMDFMFFDYVFFSLMQTDRHVSSRYESDLWPLTLFDDHSVCLSHSVRLSFLSGLIRSWMTVSSWEDRSPGTLRRSGGVFSLTDWVSRRIVRVICLCPCVSDVWGDVQGEPASAVAVIRHTENHFTDPRGAGKGHTGAQTHTWTWISWIILRAVSEINFFCKITFVF